MTKKEKLKQLIAENKTDQAIERLKDYLKETNDEQYVNDLIMFSNRFNQIKKETILGISDRQTTLIESAKLVNSLLNMIDQLPEIQTIQIETFVNSLEQNIKLKSFSETLDFIIDFTRGFDINLYNTGLTIQSSFKAFESEILNWNLSKQEIEKIYFELSESLLNSLSQFRQTGEFDSETLSGLLNLFKTNIDKAINKADNLKSSKNHVSSSIDKHTKILYLYSSPDNIRSLSFARETKIISDERQKGKLRDTYEILPFIGSIKNDELKRIIEESGADIIHISVHGNKEKELIFEDEYNQPKSVTVKQFDTTFKHAVKGRNKKYSCILISACHSDEHANTIYKNGYTECSIGMNNYIADEAALAFTQGFYEELFKSGDFKKAFDNGLYKIEMKDVVLDDYPNMKWENVPLILST